LAQSNPKKPWKKRIAESCAIFAGVALAMSTGIYMGWNARADRIPQFNEEAPLDVDQIIDVAKLAGLTCPVPLLINRHPRHYRGLAVCTGEPYFEVITAQNNFDNYLEIDDLKFLACIDPHVAKERRWFYVFDKNWGILFTDEKYAKPLGNIEGAMVAWELCPARHSGLPAM